MEDLISIIVPIYNVRPYLEQCIDSVLKQTYKNLEIILVDDGSTDGSSEICDQFQQQDNRIKVIHKKNGGLDSARKAGMSAANGEYIGYLDGDDWIEPNMYENLLRYLHEYDVEIVETGVIDTWENEETYRVLYLDEGCYKDKDFIEKVEPRLLYFGVFYEFGISPYVCNKLFLKERIMKYQMMGGLTGKIFNDTMISLPCIAESKRIYVSHDCYYHYRMRNDSLKRKSGITVSNLMKCYPEFYKRFRGTEICAENGRQIKFFMIYWLLYRAPYTFDDFQKDIFLTPFGGFSKRDKIVLYGAGAVGIHIKDYISSIEGSNIVCWLDRNYESLQQTLDVQNPQNIIDYEYDYIIISILREKAVQSVKRDILRLGVPEEKIRWIEQKYIDDPELLLSKVVDLKE